MWEEEEEEEVQRLKNVKMLNQIMNSDRIDDLN